MSISGHFHVLGMQNHTFNATPTEKLQQHPLVFLMNRTYCMFFLWRLYPGTTFTSWSKHHFVVIGKAEKQVCKASHCRTKQQWRSHVVLILFLLIRTTWVLFFTHISFVVNRTFTTTLTERLQHLQQGWARFMKWLRVEETSIMQTEKT